MSKHKKNKELPIDNDANKSKKQKYKKYEENAPKNKLHPETKKSIWAISFICIAIILILAELGNAGPFGNVIYKGLFTLFGWGYIILPLTFLFVASIFIFSERKKFLGTTLLGATLIILSLLGLIELFYPSNGGWLGLILGSLKFPFGNIAAVIINIFIFIAAILVTTNIPLKIKLFNKKEENEDSDENRESEDEKKVLITGADQQSIKKTKKEEIVSEKNQKENNLEEASQIPETGETKDLNNTKNKKVKPQTFVNYVPPPLSLLRTEVGKPTTGDLLANANIIKRTLESFGISVEMGEINVGPAVTRYTLKPAEGIKLSKITSLSQDLSLSLAAHPIRIEAPIPGKSLVGIEVPNKAAALVRLGNLMNYPEFQKNNLGFALGRDVSGEPVFGNIEKMPHLLIAGATGSGKSIFVHSIIISLLYKNSPKTMKLVLIDPKRVELSIYEGIPHLVSPVVTENKKAAGVFRWALSEMERRYSVLQQASCRDVKSYNESNKEDPMPYIVIIIDELADLMASYGREVEASIIRLAQMARATGIHLILSTQRPSVEVITGLIKANITSRIALQVASQIDSRTIIDTAGAEKLLGHGDLLFLSADLSKPKRIQGSFITEEEIKGVADFIKEHNKIDQPEQEKELNFEKIGSENSTQQQDFGEYLEDEDGDELLEEAIAVVLEAKKASASLLQRRLKVGYARAARLLDIMESQELIGPGDGAKPRDVNIEKIEERLS
jgi:S-DNA-T family DNA segregation ATPase FtsK/SpoIIIE